MASGDLPCTDCSPWVSPSSPWSGGSRRSRAQTGTGNLIKNPGFEDPLLPKLDNPFVNWGFVNHKQDFIRGEVEAQDYHSGLKAAAVSVGGTPQVYACWYQHIAITHG